MLQKLKDILRPPKPTGFVFNLKDHDYHRLKELRGLPQWAAYQQLLDKLAIFNAESMLQASEEKDVMFFRAYILGVRRAGTIIDEIIKAEEAKDARESARNDDRAKLESRTVATFGTPYNWR